MQSKVFREITDAPSFYSSAQKMIDAAKSQSQDLLPPGYVFQRSRTDTIDDFEKLLKKDSAVPWDARSSAMGQAAMRKSVRETN